MITPVLLYIDADRADVVVDVGGERQSFSISAAGLTAEALGRMVAREIEQRRWTDRPIVIALAAQRVFARRFVLDRTLLRRPAAVAYSLEESFPLDAEDMLFRTIDLRDDSHFAVATDLRWLRELLLGLDAITRQVRAVIPASLLVVQHFLSNRIVPVDGRVFLAKHPPLEIVDLQNGLPHAWQASAWSEDGLNADQHWDELVGSNDSKKTTLLRFADADEWMKADRATEVDAKSYLGTLYEAAVNTFSGKLHPWVRFPLEPIRDKGTQESAHTLALTALVSAILLSTLLVVAFWVRASRMETLASSLQQAKGNLVAKLFPGEQNIRSAERHLQTEQERLTRLTTEAERFALRGSALPMLHRILTAFPGGEGIEIATMQVLPDQATVGGTVPSLDRLDRLSQSLQANGMRVDQTRYALAFELQLEIVDNANLSSNSKVAQ